MPLPESFLSELTSRNDIESVASSYVNLKRRGRTLVGLCPFHGEKTPSFTVYPETSSFYCFGCGAGGDVITFIKKIENLDYMDAVRFLADRAGLKMPENVHVDDAVSKLRVRVLELNREAARFFHEQLYAPIGKEALDYFHGRGYTDKTIRHFGLGYAPNDFHALRDAMRAKGFHDEELLAAFLCNKKNSSVYDVFRNRVIIPIIDIRGNVIAFGGRVLDDSKPKYVNTSDTVVFQKSRNLFALNFAKAKAADELLLCEGYMDVIAMHQAGFTNAVAALGTSFTEEHATLIARYTSSVTLLFDADGAGQKAAKRAIDILRKTGVRIRVVTVPDGKDPDEYIRKNGAEHFKLLLERASNDIEYRLIDLGKQYALGTAAGQAEYLSAAAAMLATLQSPIEQDVYAGKLAESMHVSKQAILAQIKQVSDRKARRSQRSHTHMTRMIRESARATAQVNPEAKDNPRAASAEEHLIGLLLLHPDYLKWMEDKLPPDAMATSFGRGLYRQMLDRAKAGLLLDLPFLAADHDENAMAYISRMMQAAQPLAGTPEEAQRYADILLEEYRLRGMANPETLSDQELLDIMTAMRQSQQGGKNP